MFIPSTAIDTLYDYLPLLRNEELCTIPNESLGKEVAVIGAGAAGLIAAYELLKMGCKPVIYEANNRMGGRIYSLPFEQLQEEVKPFGEMGAMRIPKSSKIFFHYADKLGLSSNLIFPNSGETKTSIYYKNKVYQWEAYGKLPQPFFDTKKLWDLFTLPLVNKIHKKWEKGDINSVREIWQTYINQYKNMSLYEALIKHSSIVSSEQINILGAIGIGHGGFSSLFEVSFLEILRLLVNGYIGQDILIAGGLSSFIQQMYHLKVKTPFGIKSLAETNCVHLNLPVVYFNYNPVTCNPVVITKDRNQKFETKEYAAVIFTGSLCAIDLLNITNKTESGVYLMSSKIREAIKSSPMVASSKTYICTKNKFWLDKGLPNCILSDDLTSATYFIDNPRVKQGIVCLSYSWGMDAMKLHAVDPADRVVIFRRSLSAIYPILNDYLEPLNGEILNIDWINEKYQNGAFKLLTPGNDHKQQALYLQFLAVLNKEEDKGIYLAGDGVSWSGGWVEGALYTVLNAVFAVAKRFGASMPVNNPLCQNDNLYRY